MSNKFGTVVDVRSIGEYESGHVEDSINIPLQELQLRLEEIKVLEQPIILCCASGMRSLQATNYLKSFGIQCENGGSWVEISYKYQTA